MPGYEFQNVTVVRPYGEAIRTQVFSILEHCGLRINEGHIIPAKTSDADAIAVLKSRTSHTLLIPFHGHLDSNKKIVNGVTLYRKLLDTLPSIAVNPVFMPVDKHSAPIVEQLVENADAKNVLVIPETALLSPATLQTKISSHLEFCRGLS